MKNRLAPLFSFLLALLVIALGLAVAALWNASTSRFQEIHEGNEVLRQDLQQVLDRQQERMAGVEAEQQRLQALLNDFLEELRTRYTEHEALLEQKLEPLSMAPDPRQYPIEEISFLLHLAQYKHTYLYDPQGALSALRQARRILDSLDKVRYHPLTRLVDDAVATLETANLELPRNIHRILAASWITLNEALDRLRTQFDRQGPEDLSAGSDGWRTWLADQFRLERGAPQAVDTISVYQHILNLYAVQTELYLARLGLQTQRPESYAEALARARAILTQPALDGQYPALLADIDRLRAQSPFPPEVAYAALLRTLEKVR